MVLVSKFFFLIKFTLTVVDILHFGHTQFSGTLKSAQKIFSGTKFFIQFYDLKSFLQRQNFYTTFQVQKIKLGLSGFHHLKEHLEINTNSKKSENHFLTRKPSFYSPCHNVCLHTVAKGGLFFFCVRALRINELKKFFD